MARTFTNEPVGHPANHRVRTERGHYLMGASWIDAVPPSDMMDYDFTDTWQGLYAAHAETHRNWCAGQVRDWTIGQ